MLVLMTIWKLSGPLGVFFTQFPEIEGQREGWHCYQIFGNADGPCENCPAVPRPSTPTVTVAAAVESTIRSMNLPHL